MVSEYVIAETLAVIFGERPPREDSRNFRYASCALPRIRTDVKPTP